VYHKYLLITSGVGAKRKDKIKRYNAMTHPSKQTMVDKLFLSHICGAEPELQNFAHCPIPSTKDTSSSTLEVTRAAAFLQWSAIFCPQMRTWAGGGELRWPQAPSKYTPRVFYAMAPLLENQFDMMKGGRGCWGVKQSLGAAYAS
jgi:hypothetical protein